MKIQIFGSSSNIARCVQNKLKVTCDNIVMTSSDSLDLANIELSYLTSEIELDIDYYIFCNGILYPKRINSQSSYEIYRSLSINLISIVRLCDYILENNDKAKIIIIGSESGKKGSFDTTYFLSKAAMKKYVEERHINFASQQLLLISPSVISDSGMTLRRADRNNLDKNMKDHPKGRFLTVGEFSDFVCSIVNNRLDYITNTEIEINGGKFARMKYR